MDMRTKKSISKKKKNNDGQNMKTKRNKFLIIINVFGSAGPIRFIVNEDDNAAAVVETALKLYAREGRLPILGSDVNSFFLYPANAGLDALCPTESIGSSGLRNFVLCKKQINPHMSEARSKVIAQNGGGWRAWLPKSISPCLVGFKI
ncbi:Hypothetical predicted protein [Olea europaea subsp. europaea]|uniref:DUF7054 domain-containing protein n=1 Tax=Olea europaea subsp. europaea TaxID=158383 RepID=A0A8S0S1L7_OLEEU|nr:Hypothetical predicted protein [Olea europaea subsp. europaea]CAA3000588.1 Hypothetical predicted protein [Olea europaea subsp. europaea]